jgi:hypothetical protein
MSRIRGGFSRTANISLRLPDLCNRLRILNDGEKLTKATIAKFAEMFKGRLPPIAIDALHAPFCLDCDLATIVEDALLVNGGTTAIERALDTEDGDERSCAATI